MTSVESSKDIKKKLLHLSSQLMQVGVLDVHEPVSVQEQTAFVPPGQRGRRIGCGFGQQVYRLPNQRPGRVPTWPPDDCIQRDVGCRESDFIRTGRNVMALFCAGDKFPCIIFNNYVYYIYLVTLSTLKKKQDQQNQGNYTGC